jgi:hypothetical protein
MTAFSMWLARLWTGVNSESPNSLAGSESPMYVSCVIHSLSAF